MIGCMAKEENKEKLHQSPVFGSQLYGCEGKTNVSVSSQN